MSRIRGIRALCLAGVLVAGTASLAFAAPGDLDPTFNGNGTIVGADPLGSHGNDLLIQPDGKVLVVGSVFERTSYFSVRRFTPDGEPDMSFSTDGEVSTRFGAIDAADAAAAAVALTPGGKIVVVGSAFDGEDGALALYRANGELDRTFRDNGRLEFNSRRPDAAIDVAVQVDGRILVVAVEGKKHVLYRLTPRGYNDGSLDVDGRLTFTAFKPTCVDLQADGKIVLGGWVSRADGSRGFALERRYEGGAIDRSFGSNGRVVTPIRDTASVSALSIMEDGRIVAVGEADSFSGTTRGGTGVARYLSDGTADPSFGNGTGSMSTTKVFAESLDTLPDGSTAIGGFVQDGQHHRWAVARLLPDGALDPSFGEGGVKVRVIAGSNSAINGLAFQADGRIIAAGTVVLSGRYQFAVARHLAT
ncbi:MAG: hypothetical protein QOE83_1404 [Actinomycetota bacterium]|jgi:uncharacterized delta-60 repeat protein|nr:hypothetical protein [Actinomycetota bacterium]